MEIASTWDEAVQNVVAWVPRSHNLVWNRHNVIYWRCVSTSGNVISAHLVDPQLPGLGEHAGIRTLRTTDVALRLFCKEDLQMQRLMLGLWRCPGLLL